MGDLRARLEAALGDAYRLEREMGGGGMSHVFLAEERALNRKVVIKVLPPEMAAGVNAERFRREIQLAASLQHPHIVPLLSAGASGDLLYYTMPLVEGESLRAKLSREGELPVGETIRILSGVADALAYAHAHAVVHRDIKPDNILISGKHAVVTDFGVSKAVSASSGSPLTSLGVALGTPAYMAPEQAAADPHVDHRADLYALGVLGYEMLTGRPPFTAATPQAMLAAQVTKKPEPVTAHREAIPPALNALVMRCLEKHPADRWQTAAELQQQLESMSTPSGGMAPTGEALPLSSGTRAALRRVHPLRVAGSFGLAALAVLAAVDLLMRGLGLPDWVLYAALGLLGVGLPIMLTTGLIERRRILASTGRLAAPPVHGVAGWLTWRKATLGGVAGFAGLGLVTTAYMGMRLLGIGPVGTLVASGVLKAREPLILATFENRTGDSTLGPALAAAFRVDLSESPVVKLLDQQAVTDGLQRMERAPSTPLDLPLARELAQRERVKGVVMGEIDPVGKGYVLGASLVSAADGHVLTAVRETAEDDRALIGAIDGLSRKLRERIGESLKTIRANEPLEQVTTSSLEALRKYSDGARAEDAGYPDQAAALYQEATTIDPGFAMAYRKLAAMLLNSGGSPDRIVTATTKAFQLRDRLPEVERYLATGGYYFFADYDPPKVTAAYRSALERDPDNNIALNNLSQQLILLRQFPAAESLAVYATTLARSPAFYANAIRAQIGQGHYADAAATLERLTRALPRSPTVFFYRALVTSGQGDYAAAEQAALALLAEPQGSPAWRATATGVLVHVDVVQGKLARAERYADAFMTLAEQRGLPRAYLGGSGVPGTGGSGALALAEIDRRFRNRPADGLRAIEAALRRHPLATMPPLDRPYTDLARYYARAGRLDEAKRLLAEYERAVPEGVRKRDAAQHGAEGDILLAEGRVADAIARYRQWQDDGWCATCGFFELGAAYQQAGQPDSATAFYERAVTTPGFQRVFVDAFTLAASLQRLGELNEARGERTQALGYYQRLVDLWKDADAELQPVVRDVRARMARLASEH
jgi:eukaryotic-like serine/threonine-protein kinase